MGEPKWGKWCMLCDGAPMCAACATCQEPDDFTLAKAGMTRERWRALAGREESGE